MLHRSHLRGFVFWFAVIDLAALVAGSILSVLVRIGHEDMPEYVFGHFDGWMLFFASVITANYLAGSYNIQHSFSRFNLVVTWLFSLIFALFVLSVFTYAWLFKVLLGRGILMLSVVFYGLISLVLKISAYHGLFSRDSLMCRTIIVGTGQKARRTRSIVESRFVLPVHKVIAFMNISGETSVAGAGDPGVIDGVAVINSTGSTFEGIVRNMHADLLVAALDEKQDEKKLYQHMKHLRFEGVEFLTALAAIETYLGKTPLEMMDEDVMTRVVMESGLPSMRRLKRVNDLIFTMVLSVVWVPLAVLIACLIKLSNPRGAVIYSQLRTGQFGRVFKMYKFRTMSEDAEKGTGPVWSAAGDPRVTMIGKFLRKFRLDEMPQFINVIKGEMSIVGPRPERPELHAELEGKIPFFVERLNVLPGITGWAQVRCPYGNTVEDAVSKLEYDIYYIKYISSSLDLQIILRTIRIVLFGMEKKG